jgi:Xaa-Pro aminopeptidase
VHAIVQRAQLAAFEAVRPGVDCAEIDRVARDVITDAGFVAVTASAGLRLNGTPRDLHVVE